MWYYQSQGGLCGPIPLEALRCLVDAGTVNPTDSVRHEEGDWISAGELVHEETFLKHQAAELDSFFRERVAVTRPDDLNSRSARATSAGLAGSGSTVLEIESPALSSGEDLSPRRSWYYQIDGSETGPVEFSDLERLVATGELGPYDKVKQAAGGRWQSASRTDGLYFAKEAFRRGATDSALPQAPLALRSVPERDNPKQTALEKEVIEKCAAASNRSPAKKTRSARTATSSSAAEWCCRINGVEYGPATLETVLDWARTGRLSINDDVRRGNGKAWFPAVSFAELAPVLRSTSASPPVSAPLVQSPPSPVEASVSGPPSGFASTLSRGALQSGSFATRSSGYPSPSDSSFSSSRSYTPPARHMAGVSLAERLAFLRAPRMLVVLGLIGLVGVWWVLPPDILGGGIADKEIYESYQRLWTQFREMRSDMSDERNWQAFSERARAESDKFVARLSASSSSPLHDVLIKAGRDAFPKMFEDSRKAPGPSEEEFSELLEQARRELPK